MLILDGERISHVLTWISYYFADPEDKRQKNSNTSLAARRTNKKNEKQKNKKAKGKPHNNEAQSSKFMPTMSFEGRQVSAQGDI